MDSYGKLEVWIKLLTLLGAALAAVWTLGTYLDTKQQEFYTEFWNRKMALFQKASAAASTMATTSNPEAFNRARNDFQRLFYGEMSLVEGVCVKQAMIIFSECVPDQPVTDTAVLPVGEMQQPAYRLSARLRDELAKAWQTPFSELNQSELPALCEFKRETDCRPSSGAGAL